MIKPRRRIVESGRCPFCPGLVLSELGAAATHDDPVCSRWQGQRGKPKASVTAHPKWRTPPARAPFHEQRRAR